MHAYIIILYVTNINMEEDGGLQLAEGKMPNGLLLHQLIKNGGGPRKIA